MDSPSLGMQYETPMDKDILEAFIYKNDRYNRPDARRIKRVLRKLSAVE